LAINEAKAFLSYLESAGRIFSKETLTPNQFFFILPKNKKGHHVPTHDHNEYFVHFGLLVGLAWHISIRRGYEWLTKQVQIRPTKKIKARCEMSLRAFCLWKG